jgi:sRNA-binding protein
MTQEIIPAAASQPSILPEQARALLERLIQAYPATFFPLSERRVHPLKIGIYQDLLPIIKAWGYETAVLKYTLRNYTRPLRYQLALLKAPCRIDLQGEPAGEISTDHRQIAQEKVKLIKEKRQQHQAAQAPSPGGRQCFKTAKPEGGLNEKRLTALQQKLSTKALP